FLGPCRQRQPRSRSGLGEAGRPGRGREDRFPALLVRAAFARYLRRACGCGGMVDAGDLKSPGPCPCRFESGHPHHFRQGGTADFRASRALTRRDDRAGYAVRQTLVRAMTASAIIASTAGTANSDITIVLDIPAANAKPMTMGAITVPRRPTLLAQPMPVARSGSG